MTECEAIHCEIIFINTFKTINDSPIDEQIDISQCVDNWIWIIVRWYFGTFQEWYASAYASRSTESVRIATIDSCTLSRNGHIDSLHINARTYDRSYRLSTLAEIGLCVPEIWTKRMKWTKFGSWRTCVRFDIYEYKRSSHKQHANKNLRQTQERRLRSFGQVIMEHWKLYDTIRR